MRWTSAETACRPRRSSSCSRGSSRCPTTSLFGERPPWRSISRGTRSVSLSATHNLCAVSHAFINPLQIKASAAEPLKQALLSREGVHFVEFQSEDDFTLVAYSVRRPVLRINLNEQTKPAHRQHWAPPANAMTQSSAVQSPVKESALDVYPRDHIMQKRFWE